MSGLGIIGSVAALCDQEGHVVRSSFGCDLAEPLTTPTGHALDVDGNALKAFLADALCFEFGENHDLVVVEGARHLLLADGDEARILFAFGPQQGDFRNGLILSSQPQPLEQAFDTLAPARCPATPIGGG